MPEFLSNTHHSTKLKEYFFLSFWGFFLFNLKYLPGTYYVVDTLLSTLQLAPSTPRQTL